MKSYVKSKLKKVKYCLKSDCRDGLEKRKDKNQMTRFITALDKLYDEVQILKSLKDKQCQYVIEFMDVIDSNDSIHVVTRFIEYGPILISELQINKYIFSLNKQVHLFDWEDYERCQIVDKMSSYQILKYLNDIANGIQFLHKLHIAHRDIKPSNLLLSANNSIVISDFGCAQMFDPLINPEGKVSDTSGTMGCNSLLLFIYFIINHNIIFTYLS